MMNKADKINFVTILKDVSPSKVFPQPFVNEIISIDDFIDNEYKESNAKHGVFYFSENNKLSKDFIYQKIERIFPNTPIVLVSSALTDLTPRVKTGVPFLTINQKDLFTNNICTVLTAMPQFKVMLGLQGIMKVDVDATRMIADLNIERLHKTLQDLEVERLKTEVANKSKQLFLARVTHELRTPLTAIYGFADLFNCDNLTVEQKSSVSIIKEASADLLNIVNDLLNYSKIADGKLNIFNEPFCLMSLVKNVYELLKPKADEKGLDFQFKFLVKDDITVMGDSFRLKQVLTNLVSNAIKFTEAGCVVLTVSKSIGSNILFSVKDTGIGIKKERLTGIFENYIQAEDDTTQAYGGTGLGLAIVKELVQLQGGTISVKSKFDEGSEFLFQLSLPVVEDILKNEYLKDSLELDLSHLAILVVEDNHLNQMLIQKLLASKVKSLHIAGDGVKAIRLAEDLKFDIILMDLNLPNMSGMEIVSEIRKKGLNRSTPVAVITANVWEEELDLIKKNGIDTIIQKPFNRKDLYFQIYTLGTKNKEELISLTYLQQMSGGDHFFIVDILKTYKSNIILDMDRLKVSIVNDDYREAQTVAHKMKSSFKMLEMQEACEICEQIEFSQDDTPFLELFKVLKLIIDKSILEAKDLVKRFSD